MPNMSAVQFSQPYLGVLGQGGQGGQGIALPLTTTEPIKEERQTKFRPSPL